MRALRSNPFRFAALIAILSITASFRMTQAQNAPDTAKVSPLEGTWSYPVQGGVESLKHVAGGRYAVNYIKDGRILYAFGGKYSVDKNKYTETVQYVLGEQQADSVGKSATFEWTVKGDKWHVVGVIDVDGKDFKIDETWTRCK